MVKAIKIECWDTESAEGSLELAFGEKDKDDELPILHIQIPMLDATRGVSVWLEDFERAIRQLKTE